MTRMKRLQISLEPEMDQQLSRSAAALGVSKAEIVRRSLEIELDRRSRIVLPTADLGDLKPGVDLADARALRKLMPGLGD